MATPTTDDRNIIEADAVDWRLIVYPMLAVLIVAVGGFGYYFYQLSAREQAEATARAALIEAKAPADLLKVADRYPATTQAALALLGAGDGFFNAKNTADALKAYQRVVDDEQAPAELREAARLGLASTQEAAGKSEDAIRTYLGLAQQGARTPFAPVAYHEVAQIYVDRKDKEGEKKILQQLVQLGGDSPFIKEAAARLKELETSSAVSAILSAINHPKPATNASPTTSASP